MRNHIIPSAADLHDDDNGFPLFAASVAPAPAAWTDERRAEIRALAESSGLTMCDRGECIELQDDYGNVLGVAWPTGPLPTLSDPE